MKSLLTWCVENNRQDIIKSYVLTNINTMQDISYGSKKLAYWYCDKCKTVYTQAIQNKTIQNQNCPICSHRRLVKGINDFETFCKNHSEFSHLLLEWDYEENTLKPDEIFPNYTKTIAWKCKNGHTWKTSPNNRIHNKNNCKKCSEECRISFAEKVVLFYIKQTFSNVKENYRFIDNSQMELDIFIPDIKLGIEYDGSFWHKDSSKDQMKYKKCKECGILLYRIREQKCKKVEDIADKVYSLEEENNKDLDNAIETLFDYINEYLTNIEKPNVDWKRDYTNINNLVEYSIKEKSIANYPLLLKQWNNTKNGNLTPDRVYANSNNPCYWVCDVCGYGNDENWFVSPNSRIESNGKINGCPVCSNKILKVGINDFETFCKNNPKFLHLLSEWDYEKNIKIGLEINKIKFNDSSEIIYWKCNKCGYHWSTKLNDRTVKNSGCKLCLNKTIVKGVNDIATTHPQIANEWDINKNLKENGRTKYNTSHGYNKLVWWICPNGHSYQASPNDRCGKKHTGCPYCSNKKLLKGFNDFETFCHNNPEFLHLLSEWDYKKNSFKIDELVYGSDEVIAWKCSKCGHHWNTPLRRRTKGKYGCEKCAREENKEKIRVSRTKGKELSTVNPELAKYWDYDKNLERTPDNTAFGSNYIASWKCPICGYEWKSIVKDMNKRKNYCLMCKKRSKNG